MFREKINLRKVVAVAICLARSATMLAQETGVVINGVTWATRNVDAFGIFAPTPESSGMFYQWNRPTAWAATGSVSGWDSSLPESTEWEKVNDPSPTDWRIPTVEEIESLLDNTKVDKMLTTQNGVRGYKFTDKTSGNSIFLPAAGCRSGDDGKLSTGNHYWSSTPFTEFDYGSGYYLSFYDNGNIYRDYDIFFRNFGFSVRCVASSSAGINEFLTNIENSIATGFFDILGRKLTEELTKGIYIIQYDNGKTRKMIK